MTKRASVIIPILAILAVIFLAAAGGIFYLLQNERSRSMALEMELEDVKAKYQRTELELEGSKKKVVSLDLQLKESQNKIAELSAELDQEKSANEEALSQIETLASDLKQQKNLRSSLEDKFNQAKEDAKKIEERLVELESQKAQLESKIKDLEARTQNVELGKIVVTPEAASLSQEQGAVTAAPDLALPVITGKANKAQSASQEGKVLVINKDYNFAVINLGAKDSVIIGDLFAVYSSENKYLGDIKVEKVHDSMAAAGFVSEEMKDKISEGDKVVQKAR
jgi:chromosome segregation ATPase